MKRILVDISHLYFRAFYACQKEAKNDYNFTKYVVFNSLFSVLKKFSPDEVIIACDGKENWRKRIYPDYKAHRKLARDANVEVNWEEFFRVFNETISDMKKHFPFKVILNNYAEADDVIAVLSKYLNDGENIILGSDKDYIQLLQHDHIKMYDPLKRKFIEEKNPLVQLQIKTLCGDMGDNVPQVKNKLGEKTALKIINRGVEGWLNEQSEEVQKNYKRNCLLIDLENCPKTIKRAILDEYYSYPPVKMYQLLTFFLVNKMRRFMEEMSQVKPLLEKLER